MRKLVSAAVLVAAVLAPAALAQGRVTFEDTVRAGKSTWVELTVRW